MSADAAVKEMAEFRKNLVLWGSDAAIREWLNFKDAMAPPVNISGGHDSIDRLVQTFEQAAKFLAAMRRDLGYTFTSFSAEDLARLQLRLDDEDARKVIERLRKRPSGAASK